LSQLEKLTFFFIVAQISDRRIHLFGKEIVAEKRITFRFIVGEPQAESTIFTQARISLHHFTPHFTRSPPRSRDRRTTGRPLLRRALSKAAPARECWDSALENAGLAE